MGKRELVALLSLSYWCLVIVAWLFLAVPWICLRFVIVVFSDHTHLLFLLKVLCMVNPPLYDHLFSFALVEHRDSTGDCLVIGYVLGL